MKQDTRTLTGREDVERVIRPDVFSSVYTVSVADINTLKRRDRG